MMTKEEAGKILMAAIMTVRRGGFNVSDSGCGCCGSNELSLWRQDTGFHWVNIDEELKESSD